MAHSLDHTTVGAVNELAIDVEARGEAAGALVDRGVEGVLERLRHGE